MTIRAFQLTGSGLIPLDMPASSLDEMTGKLPQGFYTTFGTLARGTRVLGLQAHLDRLYVPAGEIELHPAVSEGMLRRRIAELAEGNLPHESRVRLILTKDAGRVYVIIQPFIPPPKAVYENGVHVITSPIMRSDPRIKATDFITKSAEQRKLVKGDVYEVLLTHNGKILEGMTSNFFAVRGKTLVTARRGILLGVTRRAALRLARGRGMSIEYRAPHVNEPFDEAFLTSSSRGVVPVVSIDDKPVGQGRVGTRTVTLGKAYQVYVEERSENISIPVGDGARTH